MADALGVAMGPGGAHPKMGTHNRLLRLGDAMFLEVIAVDPGAAAPSRPRWFGLDVPVGRPRLATWVARTTDLAVTTASLPEDVGPIETLARGDLDWLLTVPDDGSMPLEGIAPALIEWQTSAHPASRMLDAGCDLRALELFHPEPGRLRALLAAIGLEDDRVSIHASPTPGLVAHVDTPTGRRVLGATDRAGTMPSGSGRLKPRAASD